MPDSTGLIRKTKYKFFAFSLAGFVAVFFISLAGLRFHSIIVDRQENIQLIQENLFSQAFLIDKISLLSKSVVFDNKKDASEEMKILIEKIKEKKKKLKSLLTSDEYFEVEEIKEIINDEGLFQRMDNYIQKMKVVTDQKVPQGHGLALINLSQGSLDEIQSAFKFIGRKISVVQEESFSQVKKMGIIIITISFLQIILIWLLVFKPLYTTIFLQHEKINNALLETQRANRSRTEFLTNISHEIRTPMTAILGYAEVLKDSQVSAEKLEDSVGIINKNAAHLLGLIDEILDISKIESGKFNFEKEEITLATILSEVYSLMNVKARGKGINLDFQNVGEIPKVIYSDKKRLKQILFNLIGNAIKFTEEGFVRLSISYNSELEQLSFKIKDTGCGIPKDKVKSLFRPFEQADTSASRKHQGSGLGLVLSKELAKAMGGDVYIQETKMGEGTTFHVYLKAEVGQDREFIKNFSTHVHEPDKEVKKEAQHDLGGKNILVVDDAKENARLFKIYLDQTGAFVDMAYNGLEAIDKVNQHKFDIIFLDLQMPELDGYQTIGRLRQLGFKNPIVALTAHAMKEEQERTKACGFDFHVSKPVKGEYLIKVANDLTRGVQPPQPS
ncbi:MAG: hypothetical protein CME60_02385 [Halobacteriovoraceae bacterium]|nr:hypothetical protein [Halobacteriovoraceae bacterium]|tara:strand:+ start:194140 stop:195984 length:1845 start_codon:yes stop_codon:yes gene_type:complete